MPDREVCRRCRCDITRFPDYYRKCPICHTPREKREAGDGLAARLVEVVEGLQPGVSTVAGVVAAEGLTEGGEVRGAEF